MDMDDVRISVGLFSDWFFVSPDPLFWKFSYFAGVVLIPGLTAIANMYFNPSGNYREVDLICPPVFVYSET